MKLKRYLTICLTLFIVAASVLGFKVDSNAINYGLSDDFDGYRISLFMLPFDGFERRQAMSPGCSYNGIYERHSKLTSKETGRDVSPTYVLKEGEKFTYTATFTPLNDSNLSDYTVSLFNQCDVTDTSFIDLSENYPSISYEMIDGKLCILFSCDIVIQKEPDFDLGELTLDLSNGEIAYARGDNTPYYINLFFKYAEIDGLLYHNSWCQADLDYDGDYDVYEYFSAIHKSGRSKITGLVKYKLSEESCEKIKKEEGIKYYSRLTIIFTKLDFCESRISGLEAKKDWTGSPVTQTVTITNSGEPLVEGQDFEVEYFNNTDPGTATVTFTGIGKYTGDLTVNYEIVKTDNGNGNNGSNGNSGQNNGSGNNNGGNNGSGNNSSGSNRKNLQWKCDANGWWIEDETGWYPVSQWLQVDGKWYYFTETGYMDYSEYRDGCWLGADGAWVEEYYGGHWCQDSTGWWYEDASGWYPKNQYLWIDGVLYHFNSSGYWDY